MGFRVWGVNAKQLGAVSFFIVTSIAAILLNKALFKNFNVSTIIATCDFHKGGSAALPLPLFYTF